MRRGEGAGYFDKPSDVGSNPTGSASGRSLRVEQRKENARSANSRRKDLQSGGGASYFVQRLRVRVPPAGKDAVAQLAEQSRSRTAGSLCKKFPVWCRCALLLPTSAPVQIGEVRLRKPPVLQRTEAQTINADCMFPPDRDAGMARRRVTSS